MALLVLLFLSAAFAGRVVEVTDPSECITSAGLRSELEMVMGDALLQIDVFATVEEDRDQRRIQLSVHVGGHRWSEVMSIVVEDCPYVSTAVALSIQRGLSAMPGFDWEDLVRGPALLRVGGAAGASGPWAPRVLVSGRASLGERLRGIVNLRLEASPLWRNNGSRIAAITAGVSAGTSWRTGFLEVRPELGAQAGVIWVMSQDPAIPPARARPHLSGVGGVELGGSGPWSIGLHGEVSRPINLVSDSGRIVGVEPAFRLISTILYTPKVNRE